ncbi:MAG TPA: universal stress protein [Phycisphaerae bacterium]
MKVLIAYDGTRGSDVALYDLRRAGLPRDVEAVVLAAADFWMPPESPTLAPTPPSPAAAIELRAAVKQAVDDALALAQRAQARLALDFPGWRIATEAVADAPAWAIIQKAEDWGADLTVVGSRGQSPLRRLLLGSVSLKVVTELRRDVRIARGRERRPDRPVRIVFGVDGSAGSDAAIQVATARQWPMGSAARVVVVVDSRRAGAARGATGAHALQAETWSRRAADQAAQQLKAAGLDVATLVAPGDPKTILPNEAKRWNADCIFLGARGMTRIERFVLGSVSTAVALRAPCSVEIVHPAQAPS